MVDNNEHLKDVALRIRNAREILGLSEEIMAQNTDITADEYKAYENGERRTLISHSFISAQSASTWIRLICSKAQAPR